LNYQAGGRIAEAVFILPPVIQPESEPSKGCRNEAVVLLGSVGPGNFNGPRAGHPPQGSTSSERKLIRVKVGLG
jgi:hypothetical protein